MSTPASSIALDRFTSFGELLKYLRRRAGLTQRELSIAVGYSDTQISRLEQNERLPDLSTLTARFLPALQVDDEPQVATRLLELAAGVRREDGPAAGQPPYKGLYYYDEADAELFFGRESLTEAVVARFTAGLDARPRFLAIVGASGSGKSSTIRAGLIPALRWNSPTSGWPVFVLTPTAHPLEALAAGLAREAAAGRSAARLAAQLGDDPSALRLALARVAAACGAAHTLIVVDQFEELFTLCRAEAEQAAFVDSLLTAADEPGGPAVVVIGLRADFYAHCARYEALREALAQHQIYIGPMAADELRHAIEAPARIGQWKLEPGLVDLLLQDTGAGVGQAPEPGALPLLSHALLETWRRRRGRTLTLGGYAAAGGVGGAIAETAEAVFHDQLDERQRAVAKQIFLRLTELGPAAANTDTRRRVTLAELIRRPGEEPLLNEVLKTLADARLITTGQDSVEVAHEALIREWPTLRGWLEENREGLRLHRRLTEAAQEWEASGREASGLFRGARLAQALEWAEWSQHGLDLNAFEQEFLQASQTLAEREAAEREAQRQRELEAAQALAAAQRERAEAEQQRAEVQAQAASRLRARNRIISAVGAVALLAALIAGLLGWQSSRNATVAQVANTQSAQNLSTAQAAGAQAIAQRDEAQRQARFAFANQVAAQGVSVLNEDVSLGLLLSVEASRLADTYGTRNSLFTGLTHDPHLLAFLHGHDDAVTAVAFSPDGKTLASSSADHTLRLWDAATGRLLGRPLVGNDSDVLSVAFSPDGKLLASGGRDGSLRLWVAGTGQLLGEPLPGHTAVVTSVAFSPDGKVLASGSQDKTILLSDTATGQPLLPLLAGHTDTVTGVAFSPDGKTLASSSVDGTLRLWDVTTGRPVRAPLAGHNGGVTSIAFSPDGMLLASGGWDHDVLLWDVSNAEDRAGTATPPATGPLARLSGHTDSVTSVAFSLGGKLLAASSDDHTVRLWDVATRQPLGPPLTGHSNKVLSVAFSPDGKLLASGGADQALILWAVDGQPRLGQQFSAGEMVHTVSLSPNGKLLAAAGMDGGSIFLWDLTGQQPLQPLARLSGHSFSVSQVAFSPDGATLASSSWDGTIRLWDVADLAPLGLPLTSDNAFVYCLAFSPDGKTLASGGEDRTVRLWDVASRQPIGPPLTGHTDGVESVAFSPDGKLLASGSDDHTVRLWDVGTHQPLGPLLAGHSRAIFSIAFSPNGKTLASASADRTVRLWDVATHAPIGLPLTGHTNDVLSLAFSSDGRTLASSGFDNTIRLWDVATRAPLGPPLALTDPVASVAFSQDGNTLAAGAGGGGVFLWDIAIGDWQARACAIAGRNLARAEWNQYLPGQPYHQTCPDWPEGN